MSKLAQPDFRTTELDPALLSTPYQVQTSWHVIAGGPCSGKSTLIDLLARCGFRTVPEAARLYLEKEMANGKKDHPLHSDAPALQWKIKAMQLSLEDGLPANEMLFLDSAVPCCLAYCRAFGVDPNEFLPDCFQHRYASVFILAPLSFCADHERAKELATVASYLDEWQTRDYIALGYDVVRVPVMPPEERLAFVLERLPRQGLASAEAGGG